MELSIIIPTYNEEETLPRLLKSIKKQKGVDYEIIVADANSKDKTKEVAKKFGARVVKGGLPWVGKNNGARKAKADLFVFFDADCELKDDFLKDCLEEFEKRELDVASVSLIPISKNPLDWIFYGAYNFLQFITQKFDPHLTGACIFSKKKVFWNLGGFDEDLHLAEDMAFGRKARKNKFKVGILHRGIRNDVRRLKKEGRFKFASKLIFFAGKRFFGEVKESKVKYDLNNR